MNLGFAASGVAAPVAAAAPIGQRGGGVAYAGQVVTRPLPREMVLVPDGPASLQFFGFASLTLGVETALVEFRGTAGPLMTALPLGEITIRGKLRAQDVGLRLVNDLEMMHRDLARRVEEMEELRILGLI